MSDNPPSLGPALSVPPTAVGPILYVRTIGEAQFDQLVEAWSNASDSPSRSVLREAVSGSLDLPNEMAESFVDAVLGLSFTLRANDRTTVPLLHLPEAMAPEESQSLSERLTRLVSSPSIQLLSKAIDVLTEHERLYLDGRIVTDVRPVFVDGPGQDDVHDPEGVVLTHSLRIFYQTPGSESRDSFFVTMDAADLANLQSAIVRAQSKAEHLRQQLEGTVKILALEEGVSDA